MATSGREVDGDIMMMCPNKCVKLTTIPGGDIQLLSKNYAVLDMVHSRLFERTLSRPSLLTGSGGEYNCDVCESSKAEVACPSCAVSLCLSCSNEIHQKKGYQVHRLVSIWDILEGTVDVQPSDVIVNQRSVSDLEMLSDQHKMCRNHSSELVEYMCITCSEEVCKKCHLVDSHRGHECRLLQDVAQEKRDSLHQLLSALQDRHTVWNKGFDRCQELREYVNIRRTEMEGTIRAHFEDLHSVLRSREEKILSGLQEEMQSRDQLLLSQAK